MKSIVLLLTFLVVINSKCPKVVCGDISTADVCAKWSKDGQWTLKSCTDTTKSCGVSYSANITSTNALRADGYTVKCTTISSLSNGKSCSKASECQSGMCTNSFCVGTKKKDEACDSLKEANECGPKLYCMSSKCVDAFTKASGAACTDQAECQGSMLCLESKCSEMGSVASGATCKNWMSCGDNQSCISGKCADRTNKYADYEKKCTTDSDCGTDAMCNCGPDANGGGKCRHSKGYASNAAYNWYRNMMKNIDTTNCPGKEKNDGDKICGQGKKYNPGWSYASQSCFATFKTGGDSTLASTIAVSSGFLPLFNLVLLFLYLF